METGSDFIHALINKPFLIPSDAYPPSVFFLFSANNFEAFWKYGLSYCLYDAGYNVSAQWFIQFTIDSLLLLFFCQIQNVQLGHLYDDIMRYLTYNYDCGKLSKISGMPPLLLKILTRTVMYRKLKKTMKDKARLWEWSTKVSLCNI